MVKEAQEEEEILCCVTGLSADLEVSEGLLKMPSRCIIDESFPQQPMAAVALST